MQAGAEDEKYVPRSMSIQEPKVALITGVTGQDGACLTDNTNLIRNVPHATGRSST